MVEASHKSAAAGDTTAGSAPPADHPRSVPLWAIFIPIMLTVADMVWGMYRDGRIAALSEQVNSVTYQPLVYVVGSAGVDSIGMDTPLVEVALNTGQPISMRPGTLTISSTLRLTNRGSSVARIVGIAVADTMAGFPVIRTRILSSALGSDDTQVFAWNRFYDPPQILPGDSTTLSFAHEIPAPLDTCATLHYLILYKNALGQLYDTYFWGRYSVSPPPILARHIPVEPGDVTIVPGIDPPRMKFYATWAKSDIQHALRASSYNQETHSYTRAEATLLKSQLYRRLPK